jgi:hypothetical protein
MESTPKLVVEELMQKPSEVVPTLLVGLGGAGCNMVMRIKGHLKRRPDYAERYASLTKVALVDTNINDLEKFRQDADLTLLISDFEKEAYADLASGKLFLEADSHFTQWVPQNYRFRAGDTAGAGQIRIESRLGSYYQMKHGGMVPKIRKLLEALKGHEHGHRRLGLSEIRVIICFSVAGGTGSGSFLPMAYMIRDQAKALGKPNMIGVAALPAVFEDKTGTNKDGTFANGYAALKELEHLMGLGAPESTFFPEDGITLHYDPSDETKRVVRNKPFEFTYLIDRPESFTTDRILEAAGDGLYLQFYSPIFGVQAGDYDNYTQHQRFLVPHDFEPKGIKGFTSFYGSFGAAVLHVPVQGLMDYCARAASLSILRQNFSSEIPDGDAYANLRADSKAFSEVSENDESETARVVKEADFPKESEEKQLDLRERLFMKRIRLLAKCEFEKPDMTPRFRVIFTHGHRLGAKPEGLGRVVYDNKIRPEDEASNKKSGRQYSLGHDLITMLCGSDVGEHGEKAAPRLLQQLLAKVDADAIPLCKVPPESTYSALDQKVPSWAERLFEEARTALDMGLDSSTEGFNDLLDLKFLTTEGVSETAKRYFVACLRQALSKTSNTPLDVHEAKLKDISSEDRAKKIKDDVLPEKTAVARGTAAEHAKIRITNEFYKRRIKLAEKLTDYAKLQDSMAATFGKLANEEARRVEDLRLKGDESANAYILDAEAFQMENGRRLWDFFFADHVANLPTLSLSDPNVQSRISERIRLMSVQKSQSKDTALKQILNDLVRYATDRVLKPMLTGEPAAKDKSKRDGLTIVRALEDESIYRALYLSNVAAFQGGKADPITVARDIVSRFRALQPDEQKAQVSADGTLQQDYLRDKVRRVLTERASFLCSYDESRDQQGGVRPDNVCLATMSKEFQGTGLEHILKSLDIRPQILTEGWNNPREVVFYRAVLNVPLYVFGRMNEMRDFYYRFKRMSKRSKVLHIDKNWEDILPDLDPENAQEEHRKKQLRAHVVNFAALLKIRDGVGAPVSGAPSPADQPDWQTRGQPWIVYRDGSFWLRDPSRPDSPDDGSREPSELGLARLGDTMEAAIERLPTVLEAERVKYLDYSEMLSGIQDGFAPGVLKAVTDLPRDWRRSRDELRTQYGASPTPTQQLRLRDFTESYTRLCEALEGLLEHLRQVETERRTIGGELQVPVGLDRADMERSLTQSIEVLRQFSENWAAIEAPVEAGGAGRSGRVNRFKSLFKPLSGAELHEAAAKVGKAGTATSTSTEAPKG